MKKSIVIAVAIACVLAGCTNGRFVIQSRLLAGLFTSKPIPDNPLVYVDVPAAGANPVVVVDQEPIRIPVTKGGSGYQPVIIVFSLVTSGYVFVIDDKNGLNLTAAKGADPSKVPQSKCKLAPRDPTTMTCSYTPNVQAAYYSYTITVQDTTNNTTYTSDPTVMND
jgi:hypothetical protein